MTRARRFTHVLLLTGLVLSGRTAGSATGERQPAGDGEHLKQLVVMIQSVKDEQTANGAGIIFGRQANRVYIVTANHVVRMGTHQAQTVKVLFKWIPGQWWDAQLLEHHDRELDIAVLSVFGEELDVPDLSWRAWSPPEKLTAGDRVRPIGFPRGIPWFTPQQRHLFHSATPLHLRSEGELDPGNSGGALVTDDWGIVGIVSQADRPYNRASRIDRALEKLNEWDYPVLLTPKPASPPVPTPTPAPILSYEGPRVAKEVHPIYPPDVSTRNLSGTVELTCIVSIEGRATEIQVLKPLHPQLDKAAVEALAKWEFVAARKLGEPVPARMTIEMTFDLK